jgi:xanthine dehydrogenase YagR molybdenum-binding subunit
VSLEKALPTAFVPAKAGPRGDPAETNRGDVAGGMRQATAKIDHTYNTPSETHNPMEPHATIAVWDGPDKLTLYDATQGVFSDRQRVATLLGSAALTMSTSSLPYLGGGFGSKGPTWSHVVLCAMAARKVNRPVKLALERPQMFGQLGFRSPTRQSIAAGAKADGTLNRSAQQYGHSDLFVRRFRGNCDVLQRGCSTRPRTTPRRRNSCG